MGQLISFINKESKYYGWLTTARYLANENSISRAGKWVKEYVPKEFHASIHAVLIKDKQKRSKE